MGGQTCSNCTCLSLPTMHTYIFYLALTCTHHAWYFAFLRPATATLSATCHLPPFLALPALYACLGYYSACLLALLPGWWDLPCHHFCILVLCLCPACLPFGMPFGRLHTPFLVLCACDAICLLPAALPLQEGRKRALTIWGRWRGGGIQSQHRKGDRKKK